jgi:hypothetical protein
MARDRREWQPNANADDAANPVILDGLRRATGPPRLDLAGDDRRA